MQPFKSYSHLPRIAMIFRVIMLCLLVISCKKDDIPHEYLGVRNIETRDWEIINTMTGELVPGAVYKNAPSPVYYGIYCVEDENGNFYYYNISDPKTPLNKTPYIDAGPFNVCGLAFVAEKSSGIKMIDTDMNVVAELDPDIRQVLRFSNGLAAVQNENGKWGFVNTEGRVVIPMVYDEVKSFTKGDKYTVANKLTKEGKIEYYLVDVDGHEKCKVDGEIGDDAAKFSEGYFIVRNRDGEYYSYDQNGDKAVFIGGRGSNPERYIENVRYRNGDVIFFEGRKAGLKDYEGRVTLSPQYSSLYGCRLGNKYYIATKDKSLSGVVDRNNIVKIPFEFNVLEALNHQRLVGVKNNVARIIDLDGKPVGKHKFSKASTDFPPVGSDHFNPEANAREILEKIGPYNVLQVNPSMDIGDIRQSLYDSRVAHKDSSSFTFVQDRFRTFKLKTGRPYIKKDGTMDFKAPISSLVYSYNISQFTGAADKMQKHVELYLPDLGYEKSGEHKFTRKNDGRVTLTTRVEGGNFYLTVLYKHDNNPKD